jgi:hypothetical protein
MAGVHAADLVTAVALGFEARHDRRIVEPPLPEFSGRAGALGLSEQGQLVINATRCISYVAT